MTRQMFCPKLTAESHSLVLYPHAPRTLNTVNETDDRPVTFTLIYQQGVYMYMHSATHTNSGRDVFLIREAVVGGERGGGVGLVHLSQAASLPVLLPPPRERSTAVTGKPYCPERGSHSSPPSSIPVSLQPSTSLPKHPCKRMKRTSKPSHCAVSLRVCNFKPL